MIMSRPTTILCRPDSVETARKIIKATRPADQEEEQLRRKLEAVIVADDVTERDRQESLAELLNKPGEEPIIAAPDRCLPPGITPGRWKSGCASCQAACPDCPEPVEPEAFTLVTGRLIGDRIGAAHSDPEFRDRSTREAIATGAIEGPASCAECGLVCRFRQQIYRQPRLKCRIEPELPAEPEVMESFVLDVGDLVISEGDQISRAYGKSSDGAITFLRRVGLRDRIAWLFTGGLRGFQWYNAVAIYGAVIGAGLGLMGLLLLAGKWLGG